MERRACSTCKSFFDENPDVYRISAHLDDASIATRIGRLTEGSISLSELAEFPSQIGCPCLRAIVQAAVDMILEASASRQELCPVLTPSAAEVFRRSLVKRRES